MATCDSLKPIVLLTDVMSSNVHEIETVFVPSVEEDSNSRVDQTEPLNLCLNGDLLDGFAMVEYCDFGENGSLSGENDDDVIFVKEYKVSKEKTSGRANGQRVNSKETPRRNPVRKARVTKRFKEYTDESFEESDFFDDSAEDEDPLDISENFSPKSEDCEDWKLADMLKKNKPKRKVISKKMSNKYCRLGRKRKLNNVKIEETKVPFKELQELIQSNLLLVKNYIKDVKTVNEITKKESGNEDKEHDRTTSAINIFKNQIVLLAITKETDSDASKYLTD